MESQKRGRSNNKLNSLKSFSKYKARRNNVPESNWSKIRPKNNWRPFDNGNGKNRNFKYVPPKIRINNNRVPDLYLWIKETCNNIFLTVTAPNGDVRFSVSGGLSGLRGNNKTSYRSIEVVTNILISKLRKVKVNMAPFKSLCIFLSTAKNKTIKSILEILKGFNRIYLLVARVRIPHNGLRPRSIRRLLRISVIFDS